MNKLVEAAKDMVEIAKCEHDLTLISMVEHTGGSTTTTECRKCRARFTTYEPAHL